mgnify:CR=1 FL=1
MANCNRCWQEIRWLRDGLKPDGNARFLPLDADGTPHRCPAGSVLTSRPSTTVQIPQPYTPLVVADEVNQRIERLQEQLDENLATLGTIRGQAVQKAVEAAQALTLETLHTLRAAVNADLITAQRRIVAEAVEAAKAQVPVEHHLYIHNGVEKKLEHVRPHFRFEELVTLASLHKPVFMVGPAGGGKTTAAEQLSKVLGLQYREVSMNPATSAASATPMRSRPSSRSRSGTEWETRPGRGSWRRAARSGTAAIPRASRACQLWRKT